MITLLVALRLLARLGCGLVAELFVTPSDTVTGALAQAATGSGSAPLGSLYAAWISATSS